MKKRIARAVISAAVLWTPVAPPLQAQEPYPAAPQAIQETVNATVASVNRQRQALRDGLVPAGTNPIAQVSLQWNKLFFYTVADALATGLRLEVHRNIGETARADKQTGAGAAGSGSTTLAEKSGVPLLLAYAIEHGAITQAVSGTSITLSTTPYGLVAGFGGKDTAENYRKYGHWGRLGFSASFNTGQGQPAVETVRPKQLENWSARYVLFGDRSTRSGKFQEYWENSIGVHVQRRLNLLTGAQADLLNDESRQDTPLARASDQAITELLRELNTRFPGTADLSDGQKREMAGLILQFLEQRIYRPVREGDIPVHEATRKRIVDQVIPSLQRVEDDLRAAREHFSAQMAAFFRRPQMTLAYTHHRTAEGSDLSELKLLLDGHLAPMDFVLNAGATLFHSPDRALGQQTLRSFHLSGSLEWQGPSPFRVSENDLSRTLVSLSGRFQRSLRNGAAAAGNGNGAANGTADDFNIGIFQGKVEIPLGAGLALPFSFTYATRTERIDEKEVRGNFGLTFDLDKLYGLLLRMDER